ncbi:SGNH/GDSL hydrolase family protein [Sphingobacterium sp. Mn56C]|uniref:SGNH/GDSL hydrolase family protein n=1 Tax=Sphingobacterium sp. Mn56C TaxID=3395261 RepID=UPI003BC85559
MKNLNINTKLYIGLAAMALVVSCKPEFDSWTAEKSATADFSKVIAVGNSLSAGYADGGLYLEGQQAAFPNLIADKMKGVGAGEFKSPWFPKAQENGSGYLRLKALVNGSPVTEFVTDKTAYTDAEKNHLLKNTDDIQNLGVPGIRVDHSQVPLVSAANMFFERLLPDAEVGKKSYLDFVSNRNHTFFTCWIGGNDILGFATNGGVLKLDGTATLTTLPVFQKMYADLVNRLTEKGQKGILGTIPDVTSIPHFTTVTRQALLAAVNAKVPTAVTDIYINTKAGVRPATDQDMFVLPFLSEGLLGVPNSEGRPYGLDPRNAVEDRFVLDTEEAKLVQQRTDEFNTFIKSTAESKGLALADMSAFLHKVKFGYNYNGIPISAKFISGNAFSLDGIHLTPLGNAITANVFIEAINAKYGSRIEKVDASKYRGVKLP